MIAKIPIIGFLISYKDLFYAFMHSYDKSISKEFSLALSQFMQSKFIYPTNSGISSFYIILKALKERSKKLEVILPTYTAGSLVVGIIKAGLKPVLCDISLKDFNLDRDNLLEIVSSNTLAVVLVHMFGIGIKDIGELRNRIPSQIFLIEDCAQAMGSKIGQNQVGSFGDLSFFSFNRGKNLPTFGGGCIAINSESLAESINSVYRQEVGDYSPWNNSTLLFKILAFSLATKPLFYGFGYPFILRFKDVSPPRDFSVKKNSPFQAGLGLILLRKMEELAKDRFKKGIFLINALKDIEGLITPEIPQDTRPVFNRLPIVFKDLNIKEEAEKRLWASGIETSRMYLRPLHRMFNLGYKKENFPNANYFSEHLLTLPVNPLVKKNDLFRIIDIIVSTIKR